MPPALTLPSPAPGQSQVSVELDGHLVIVGANGSGKSRFGVWIEENNQASRIVHRISAQKALTSPEYSTVRDPEEAEKELLYGRSDQHANIGNKRASRWGNEPTTFLLNDYERLLSLLFAKDSERNHQYVANARQAGTYAAVPDSPIDKITRVWSDVMPRRVHEWISTLRVLLPTRAPGRLGFLPASSGRGKPFGFSASRRDLCRVPLAIQRAC
jgi:hypothetical protein